jgi:hypothetical protein
MTKKWLFVMAKSGAVFAFDTEKVKYLTYKDGYFVADGYVTLDGHKSFKKATEITIHRNEISCRWYEDAVV